MARALAYQRNPGGFVALLPDGRVEFLHPAIEPLLAAADRGELVLADLDFDEYILTDPLVRLERFHLSAPAIAFIETTNLCNLRCTHCYAWSGKKRPDEMPTAMIRRLIDEFDEMGVLQVFLTGGELFAHPDAIELICHAMTKRFSTQIFTNGLLITEEKVARLPPGTSFFISFDTASPTRTVRGKMDYPTLRRCFEWFEKYGHAYRTAVSVHHHNIEDVEEIFEWCAQHGFPRPQWLETHPIGRALLHPDMILKPGEVDRVFEIYRRCMDRYSAEPEPELPAAPRPGADAPALAERIRGIDTIKFCQRLERATGQEKCGRSIAYVNSAGDVFPCSNCMSNEMYRSGNLREQSFRAIWEAGFDAFRDITFADFPACRTCPVESSGTWCQFRCPPLAKNVSGDERGCGATDYLREFMQRSGAYWSERRRRGVQLTMTPTRRILRLPTVPDGQP